MTYHNIYTIMKNNNKLKRFVILLVSMLYWNASLHAQIAENPVESALVKYRKSLKYVSSEDQNESKQAFSLLKESADGGVMEACSLMGSIYEQEGMYSDAAMYYMEALKMKIVASDNNDDVRNNFNECRRGFLRSMLIETTAKSPIESKDVDLGLSVKWSNCNYNASNIEDIGSVMDYNSSVKTAKKGYRLPSVTEWKELMDNCIWIPAVVRGVSGFFVFGKGESMIVYGTQPDNVLFLPGGYSGLTCTKGGVDGYYWTRDVEDAEKGRFFTFYNNNTVDTGSAPKDMKLSVRLVKCD